ncbi:septum formation inhibitor Maf [Mycobacterium gordonae]|uniref:Nucleoside triphosphate pyrophosphatase n=1 Tax=Mycobacterium gordonae TaxID=1778 RepID=A0A0Q2R177_MYCGO|nr:MULTISPECIES: nucleoside triphosphate pyrophosphatase [Mycobacterium]KQH77782.1 septum formation inhibitor Maf [Mycobacterium gordonae]MDP7729952.1 nucleoside triphosphate pyrophosphatase [Mycobacterium sp. TY813]
MTRLVLGSASAGRLKVLRQAGVDPLVRVSGIDEDALIAALGPRAAADEVVRALARAKAEHVTATLEEREVTADCVVLGCDSMLYLDGRLCGKPVSTDDARRQWRAMAGRTGRLHTGHCLIQLRDHAVVRVEAETSITTVHFGTPADSDLEAYLASGEPLRVAGAFTLDGLGGWFIDGVGGDPSTVIGVSLPLLRALLLRCGLSVAELWTGNVGPSS